MQITEDTIGDVLILGVSGRLDVSTAATFEALVLQKIDTGTTRMVLDLKSLQYISSAGLRGFMVAARRLKGVQGRIAVCALPPAIQEIFEISGFTALFPAFADRQAAAAGVAS